MCSQPKNYIFKEAVNIRKCTSIYDIDGCKGQEILRAEQSYKLNFVNVQINVHVNTNFKTAKPVAELHEYALNRFLITTTTRALIFMQIRLIICEISVQIGQNTRGGFTQGLFRFFPP